jgi:hypothetical protein
VLLLSDAKPLEPELIAPATGLVLSKEFTPSELVFGLEKTGFCGTAEFSPSFITIILP